MLQPNPMSGLAETELLLTADHRLYHINLKNEDIADDVILVGDQGRVEKISAYFDTIDFKTAHREFITHTGTYKGKRITVISTGIGTDNIDIVLNELDAAVNINPLTRHINANKRQLNLYRLGTSGSLQADLPVNALVCSSHGIGLDGILPYYANWETVNENELTQAFIKHCHWPKNFPFPYCVSADNNLFAKFSKKMSFGITATAPGFYGPQGRELRLKTTIPQLNDLLATFALNNIRITNFEMETSALYGLGKLLNHRCLTICVIIANRALKNFTTDYEKSIEILITACLDTLTEKN